MAGELRVGGADQNGSKYIANGTATLSNATLSVGALTLARGNYLDNTISGTVTLNSGSTLVSTNDAIVQYAGKGFGKLAINGGTFVVGPTAAKWFMVGWYDSGAGELDITNGNLFLENNSSIKICRGGNTGTNLVNQIGGNVTFYSDAGSTIGGSGNLDLSYAGVTGSSSIYNLNGGTLTVPQIISSSTAGTRTLNFNGGTLRAAATTTAFMNGLTRSNVRNGGAVIDTAGFNITISQALQHSAIPGDNLTDGGLTKNGNGTLSLSSASSYTGNTTVNAGTLELAQATLATNSTVSLGSGTTLQLDFAGTNRVAALVLGGLVQPGGIYNNGTAPGYITGPGSLQVPSTVATNPTNITFTVNAAVLTISWPAGHRGWRLQAQTNSLGTNWFDVAGSTATNTMAFPVDLDNRSVFYRLVYP